MSPVQYESKKLYYLIPFLGFCSKMNYFLNFPRVKKHLASKLQSLSKIKNPFDLQQRVIYDSTLKVEIHFHLTAFKRRLTP